MNQIKVLIKKQLRKFMMQRMGDRQLKNFKGIPFIKGRLTDSEWEEASLYWRTLGYPVKRDYFEVFKAENYYDKKFLPEDIYVASILPALNPRVDSFAFVNKGLYDLFFKEIPHPECFVKNIAGIYWRKESMLTMDEVCTFLVREAPEFIIKPSVNTCGGVGVKKIDLTMMKEVERKLYIKNILQQYDSDFVIQKIVDQHRETAQFNPESLNTFRICSLFLNGKLSILTRLLRCGQNGSVVDNGTAGGIMIPVSPDGRLAKYGIDHHFKKYEKSSNGIIFEGICIQDYPKLEQFIAKYYCFFPTCHLVAWDLAIDKEGNPLMVEVNLVGPGITEEQIVIGPFLGDRTDEVIEYVKTHPGKLNIQL